MEELSPRLMPALRFVLTLFCGETGTPVMMEQRREGMGAHPLARLRQGTGVTKMVLGLPANALKSVVMEGTLELMRVMTEILRTTMGVVSSARWRLDGLVLQELEHSPVSALKLKMMGWISELSSAMMEMQSMEMVALPQVT